MVVVFDLSISSFVYSIYNSHANRRSLFIDKGLSLTKLVEKDWPAIMAPVGSHNGR